MDWEGVAMVEFRVNTLTLRPELIEVNGRFWGSLPLAINSGVDFPYFLYRSIVDKEDFNQPSYKTGFRQRWLVGDILWLYSSLVSCDEMASSIKKFLLSWSVPEDIMTLDDMNPTCGQILSILDFLTKVARGHRSLTGEVVP
jgi:predicted ATP-grasp superfamily ATP-dependent carboligase